MTTENNSHAESVNANVNASKQIPLPPAAMSLPAPVAPTAGALPALVTVDELVACFCFSNPQRAAVEARKASASRLLANAIAAQEAARLAIAAIDEELESMPEDTAAKASCQESARTLLACGFTGEAAKKALSLRFPMKGSKNASDKVLAPPGEQRIQHVPEKVQNVCLTTSVVEQIEALVRSAGLEGIEARKVTAAFSYLPKTEVFKVLKNIVASHRGQQEGATVARKYWFNPGE